MLVVLLPNLAAAQAVPVRALTAPEARSTIPMSEILTGPRELSDGRLLVIDAIERRVLLLNREMTLVRSVGRSGSGPGEYLQPSAIFALAGDTSAIRDGQNGSRLTLIPPTGTTSNNVNANGLREQTAGVRYPTSITAVDAGGNFYGTTRPSMIIPGNRDTGDTLAIVRWSSKSPQPTLVALLPTEPRPPGTIVVGGMTAYPAPVNVPFRSRPQWTVAPDGRVAVAHHTPYRVEIFDTTGKRIVNSRPSNERIRVTDAYKTEWLKSYEAMLERERRRYGSVNAPAPAPWPDYVPAFVMNAIRFDPAGRLWIERTAAADVPPTFDVIDKSGRIAFKVTIPRDTRLIGFGANGAVFVARGDVSGLEFLERYRLN